MVEHDLAKVGVAGSSPVSRSIRVGQDLVSSIATRKLRLFVLLSALVALLSSSRPTLGQMALAPGDPAPQLSGVTFPVKTRYAADWSRNKLTLVNFWATWCEPCREEMPQLQKLFEDQVVRGFRVVGVFERWEIDQVGVYLEKLPVTYTIIQPDAIVDHHWGRIKLKPTSFLVDQNGRVLRRYVGASPEQIEGLVADVEAVLDGRPLPTQVMPAAEALSEEFKERLKGNR